jgi:hypothetical protein
MARHRPRELRRLYRRRTETMRLLHDEARRNLANGKPQPPKGPSQKAKQVSPPRAEDIRFGDS